MTEENVTKKSKLSYIYKVVVGLGVIAGLIVSITIIDARFAKTKEVEAAAEKIQSNTTHAIELAEVETVKTLKDFQTQQQTLTKMLELQILTNRQDNLNRHYLDLKRQLSKTPEDTDIKEELQEIKHEKRVIKEKIEKKMQEK